MSDQKFWKEGLGAATTASDVVLASDGIFYKIFWKWIAKIIWEESLGSATGASGRVLTSGSGNFGINFLKMCMIKSFWEEGRGGATGASGRALTSGGGNFGNNFLKSRDFQILKFSNISSYFLFLVDGSAPEDAEAGSESKLKPLKF